MLLPFTWLFPVFALDVYLWSSLFLWSSRDRWVSRLSEQCSWVPPMCPRYACTGVNFRIFPNSPYSRAWLWEWPAFENGIWDFICWSKTVLGTFVVCTTVGSHFLLYSFCFISVQSSKLSLLPSIPQTKASIQTKFCTALSSWVSDYLLCLHVFSLLEPVITFFFSGCWLANMAWGLGLYRHLFVWHTLDSASLRVFAFSCGQICFLNHACVDKIFFKQR